MTRIFTTTFLTGLTATAALADPGHGATVGHVHWYTYAAIAALVAAPFVVRKFRKSN